MKRLPVIPIRVLQVGLILGITVGAITGKFFLGPVLGVFGSIFLAEAYMLFKGWLD